MMTWRRNMLNSKSKLLILVSMLVLALAFTGCDNDDDNDDSSPVGPQNAKSQLRVTHLSPDAPAVDVWVDGELVLSNVDYLAVSEYLELDAGEHNVQVYAAGTMESPVIDADVDLMEDAAYTVAATGTLDNIQPSVYMDVTEPAEDVQLRFVHASPDAPAVDITDMDGNVIFENVQFNEATSYLNLPEAAYNLQVRLAGSETIVLTLSNVALNAETNYTVWAVGLAAEEGDMGLMAFATAETGTGSTSMMLQSDTAMIRVSHLSPDAPPVDVYVDGRKVLENVAYLGVSPYLTVGAGTRNIKVYAAGTMDMPVIDADVTVDMDMSYTVAAVGELASIAPAVYMDDREQAGDVKVRFIHTSPNAPAVDITLADGTPLFEDVSFPNAADYISVGEGSYDLQVRVAGTDAVVVGFNGVALSTGDVITIWAVGMLNGSGDAMLQAVATVDAPGNGDTANVLTPDMASVRVAHLSPDAPAVDVYVDGMMVLENVGYLGVSPYLMLNSGARTIHVFATGTSNNPVIDAVVDVETDMSYTVAAIGSLDLGNFGPVVSVDQREGESVANVRFMHASPDAPAVNITLTDGTILFEDVEFGEFSPGTENYAGLEGGTFDLQVRTSDSNTIVQQIDGVTLSNGTVYTLWAVDFLSDDGLVRVAATEDNTDDGSNVGVLEGYVPMAELRVGHLSPDAPNVDVYFAGEMVLQNVPYLTVSDYLEIPAGWAEVQVYVTGDNSNPVLEANLWFETNLAYTAAATGFAAGGSNPLTLNRWQDDRTAGEMAHLRFIHTSPDAPAVDVGLLGGATLFASTEYPEVADESYLGVGGATYDLEVRLAGTSDTVLELPGIDVMDGVNYSVFAVGTADGGDEIPLEALIVVDSE